MLLKKHHLWLVAVGLGVVAVGLWRLGTEAQAQFESVDQIAPTLPGSHAKNIKSRSPSKREVIRKTVSASEEITSSPLPAWIARESPDRQLVIVATDWARRDPEDAAAWAAQLPDGADRVRVIASVTAVWAENEPEHAARYAASLPVGSAQNEAVVSAISGWAGRDPEKAAEWAMQFKPGDLQDQAYTQVAFAWAQKDASAAAKWLLALPQGASRDMALSAFCGAMVERNPTIALSFCEEIEDANERGKRVANVVRRWLEADRSAAETELLRAGYLSETTNYSLQ